MIKEPHKKLHSWHTWTEAAMPDDEHVQREREYWRFDPYEDIGPLFFSDLYEGREGEPWG